MPLEGPLLRRKSVIDPGKRGSRQYEVLLHISGFRDKLTERARRRGLLLANLVSPFVAREEEPHHASDRTCPPSGGSVRDSDAAD
jgi:hypothetical protein